MTELDKVRRGVSAIQNGRFDEGARLLNLALRQNDLSSALRATVYIWLAETKNTIEHKIHCYKNALKEDPENEAARERLEAIQPTNIPSPPPVDIPLPPSHQPSRTPPNNRSVGMRPVTSSPRIYRTTGIINGTNGPATAFFVATNGLLATTRFAVSGLVEVTVELEPEHTVQGQIVRSYPEYDLAFIKIDLSVTRTLTFARASHISDNTPFTAISHYGDAMQGFYRTTKRDLKAYWIPTTFRNLPDVGGNPLLDQNNHIVGMLTRVSSRSSENVFGLTIHHIRHCAETYLQDVSASPQKDYCPQCGNRSVAGALGGFYCEHCGGILPKAADQNRFVIPELNRVYSENMSKKCAVCSARVGYWDDRCLRCGSDIHIA